MLTIEAPYYFIKDSIVFRDHQDADQFYCLPGTPKLSVENGKLDFTLYKYRFDITGNPGSDPTRAKGAGLALFSTEIPGGKPSGAAGRSRKPVGQGQCAANACGLHNGQRARSDRPY